VRGPWEPGPLELPPGDWRDAASLGSHGIKVLEREAR
jgi:hypothetical protein